MKYVSFSLLPKIYVPNIRDRYSPRVLKINMVLIPEQSDLLHGQSDVSINGQYDESPEPDLGNTYENIPFWSVI